MSLRVELCCSVMAMAIRAMAIPSPLLVNEDCWHYFMMADGVAKGSTTGFKNNHNPYPLFSRDYTATQEGLEHYIDDLAAGGKITHFLMNVNASKAFFPSKVFEPIWTGFDLPGIRSASWTKTLQSFYESGRDPYRIWIDRCRKDGIKPWVSVRMNDVHVYTDPHCGFVSRFLRSHPELRVDPTKVWDGSKGNGWYDTSLRRGAAFDEGLDYSRPEVSERMLAFIGELLARYDVDGFELDFTRGTRYLTRGKEQAKSGILTAFMREVRSRFRAAEARLGHPITVAVRLLPSPSESSERGLAADIWAREGLVDVVIPCNFYERSLPDIRVGEWRNWLKADVKVIPGTDTFLVTDDGRWSKVIYPQYVDWAAKMKRNKADGHYLFNIFCLPKTTWDSLRLKGVGDFQCEETKSSDVSSIAGKRLPDWAVRIIAEGMTRFRMWKGDDEVVSFPLMTDCHSRYYALSRNCFGWNDTEAEIRAKTKVEEANLTFEGEPVWEDPKVHVLFLRQIAHEANSDFIMDLGDHDFEYFVFKEPTPMPVVEAGMKAYRRVYEGEELPTLFARGNHDHSKGRISDQTYGDMFNRSLNAGKDCNLMLSKDGTFGYLDLPKKGFRAIFLNSSRSFTNGLPTEELRFLSETLVNTPADWHVVVLQHIPIPQILNRCRRGGLEWADANMGVAQGMLEDFANRRGDFWESWGDCEKNVYTLQDKSTVRWNFAQVKAHFAGGFFGHAHCEESLDFAHAHWTVRPGYGTIIPADRCGEMRDPKYYGIKDGVLPKDTMMLDLVAIKPRKRQVRVFRFGWGGRESEREYTY